MGKIIKIVAALLLLVVLFFSWRLYFRFLPFIPHERITISLPFAKEDDDLIFINPMGETDHHDPPRGHPGLDFAWNHPASLLAVADGKVSRIDEHPPQGFGETEKIYDMEIVSGMYAVRYTEMLPTPEIKVGKTVNKGEVIGRGGKFSQADKGGLGTYYHTHWEFDYDSFITDRLCPLTYFDAESLSRINAIWGKVGSTFNGQFPEICSGFYHERNELQGLF